MKKPSTLLSLILIIGVAPVLAQEAEEEPEPEPTWEGSLGLAWVSTSGNTDTSTLGLDFALERKPEPWGLEILARGNRADESGVKTAENYLVSARDAHAERAVASLRRAGLGERPLRRV